ncbi:MAG: amidohydrolase family protein [Bryobacteraceae bacterium]
MLDRRTLLRRAAGVPLLAARQSSAEPMAADLPRIWDTHCHLTDVPGDTPEERMAQIAGYLDRMGIERVMLSLGFPLETDPSPEQMRLENDQVLRAIRSRPDHAYGFVYLNPNHLQASLDEFDRCVRDGPMIGVKLWVARHCSAPEVDPIAERAAKMKVPVLQHTWFKNGGNGPGESSPTDMALLAARHPDVQFIAAHTGGNWELGIRALRNSPNVCAEVAGSNPTAGFVEMAIRELGPQRLIYGSDAWGRSFASQLGKVMGAEIEESSRSLILGGNLRRLLSPILRAKGYAS